MKNYTYKHIWFLRDVPMETLRNVFESRVNELSVKTLGYIENLSDKQKWIKLEFPWIDYNGRIYRQVCAKRFYK